jgi:hypothetical protein
VAGTRFPRPYKRDKNQETSKWRIKNTELQWFYPRQKWIRDRDEEETTQSQTLLERPHQGHEESSYKYK